MKKIKIIVFGSTDYYELIQHLIKKIHISGIVSIKELTVLVIQKKLSMFVL